MARIFFAPFAPAMCCVAPLIPQATYRSAEIFVPVWPTWSVCGRQPALVTTREHPDDREALRRADPAAAADDHLCVAQGNAAARFLDSLDDLRRTVVRRLE